MLPRHGSDQRLVLLPQSRIVRLQLVQGLEMFTVKYKPTVSLYLLFLPGQSDFQKVPATEIKYKLPGHIVHFNCEISNSNIGGRGSFLIDKLKVDVCLRLIILPPSALPPSLPASSEQFVSLSSQRPS